MILKDFLLAQFEREAALTRKAVDRVPEGHSDFKPHERSMELGKLSALVASMLGWIELMIDRDELDLDQPESQRFRTQPLTTRAELIASYDTAIANARRALASTTDEHLLKPWAFKMGGNPVSTNPRHIMISDSVYSHLAHHRGQLTVYLRLLESKVPALYGPSADEWH